MALISANRCIGQALVMADGKLHSQLISSQETIKFYHLKKTEVICTPTSKQKNAIQALPPTLKLTQTETLALTLTLVLTQP